MKTYYITISHLFDPASGISYGKHSRVITAESATAAIEQALEAIKGMTYQEPVEIREI